MSVIITPADQEDARLIAAELEDGILAWPGYELRATGWPAPAVFIVPEPAAQQLLERLYGFALKPNMTVSGVVAAPPAAAPEPQAAPVPEVAEPKVEEPAPVPKPSGGNVAKKAAIPKPGSKR
jgi:hypothetical protein